MERAGEKGDRERERERARTRENGLYVLTTVVNVSPVTAEHNSKVTYLWTIHSRPAMNRDRDSPICNTSVPPFRNTLMATATCPLRRTDNE